MLVWIASYPRSGNTWLRLLLKTLLAKDDWELDAGPLRFAPIASDRYFIETYSGFWTSDLTAAELRTVRRTAHQRLADLASDRPLFVKVHDRFLEPGEQRSIFAPKADYRVIYIVRDPGDVAVSLAAYLGVDHDRAVAILCDQGFSFATAALARGRTQVAYPLGAWSGHVSGWLAAGTQRLRLIRYERLLADTHGELAGLCRWLGLALDDAAIARAVERMRFDRLQASEDRQGFAEAPGYASGRFFRRGRAGEGRHLLSPRQLERIDADCGPVMADLGYAPMQPTSSATEGSE